MAKRRTTPTQIIDYWSRRLGLDPRATKIVASGEGGLVDRPGTEDIGDLAGGGSVGPYQLYARGAFPTKLRHLSLQQRDDWAWSPAGIKYALSQQAKVARGLKGEAAINAIIRRFERPADPNKSVRNAIAKFRAGQFRGGGTGFLPTPNDPGSPSSPIFGTDSSTSSVDSQRKAVAEFLMSQAKAHSSGGEAPSLLSLATTLGKFKGGSVDPAPQVSKDMVRAGMNPTARFGADVPASVRAGLMAKKMGLSVRENPWFDPVDPVHVKHSDHYKVLGKYKGKPYGAALDVSGDPAKEQRFFQWVEANRRQLGLDDMFHDPMNASWDEGRKIRRNLAPGHGHVHASFRR